MSTFVCCHEKTYSMQRIVSFHAELPTVTNAQIAESSKLSTFKLAAPI